VVKSAKTHSKTLLQGVKMHYSHVARGAGPLPPAIPGTPPKYAIYVQIALGAHKTAVFTAQEPPGAPRGVVLTAQGPFGAPQGPPGAPTGAVFTLQGSPRAPQEPQGAPKGPVFTPQGAL